MRDIKFRGKDERTGKWAFGNLVRWDAEEFTELYSLAILDRLRPIEVHFNWESMRE